jgi:DNA invertase Pin-like site-specific DNA recombinase
MQYIYSRVSTVEQNVEQQSTELKKKYKYDGLFEDEFSGKSLDRPEMNRLIDVLVSGDSVVFYDISRIGRNTMDVVGFCNDMQAKGVNIIIHTLGGVDITSPTGKMVLTTLSAIAEMQRTEMLEKQRIGIARAKEEGKYKGKQQSKVTVAKCTEALNLINKMEYSKEKAAKAAGVGVATLYRYIKEHS